MLMRPLLNCVAVCLLLCGYVLPATAGDPKIGQHKADICLGCHGVPSYTNVYPSYHVPKLAGQHVDYIISALQAYQSGERQHASMAAQAHSLSPADQADIAAYFAALPSSPPNPDAVAPPAIAAAMASCVACHGVDGNSATMPTFPRLAGQHQNYLYHSLQAYKSAQRSNPIMAGIVASLSDDDMRLLSAYYASMPGLGTIDVGHVSAGSKQVEVD